MAFNNVLYIVDVVVVVVGFVNDIVVIFYFFFFATAAGAGAAAIAVIDIDGGGCVVALYLKTLGCCATLRCAATRLQHIFSHFTRSLLLAQRVSRNSLSAYVLRALLIYAFYSIYIIIEYNMCVCV